MVCTMQAGSWEIDVGKSKMAYSFPKSTNMHAVVSQSDLNTSNLVMVMSMDTLKNIHMRSVQKGTERTDDE